MPKDVQTRRGSLDDVSSDDDGETSVKFTESGNLGLNCTPSETGQCVVMGINVGRHTSTG